MDEDQLTDTIERDKSRFLSFAYGITRCYHAAEDIVQNVFIRLWKRAEKIKSPLGTMAVGVRRESFTFLKRRKLDHLDERVPYVDDEVTRREIREGIETALQELPDEQEMLMRSYLFEDLTCQGLAEQQAVPMSTVRGRIYRAKRALQDKLKRFRVYL